MKMTRMNAKMNIDAEIIGDMIISSSKENDIKKVYMLINKLRDSVETDPVAVKWLVEPKNIKSIHDALVDGIGISSNSLMIKGPVPNRQRRAIMMVHAMERSVKKALGNGLV
jgi:hypothetical protein